MPAARRRGGRSPAGRPLAGGAAGPRRLRAGGSRPVRGGSPVGGSRSAPRGRSLVAEVQQLPADHWREVGMDR
ncbi:hypothetical protein KVH30_00640 [Streptomyces olivaceus]|uniref:hypothetical protein n=1 Tax=Streptomyces olivaceus TaxID=47716 RepID=UPI001CC95CE8|nr:hypothetical protein [Streptomyces olivaceus]MBZ6290081.1 hypothetical protein [Streptomyces olivaceus]MBZ6324033.1 hypothetical protein [Streptomyces olivaceus]